MKIEKKFFVFQIINTYDDAKPCKAYDELANYKQIKRHMKVVPVGGMDE